MNFTPSIRLAGIEKSVIRQIYDRAPADAINLGLGEPDFPTPEVIRNQAIDFIKQGKIRYSANAGLPELRRAIAGYYGDEAKYNGVCVTNGSQEALFVALMALINPGDEVLLPDPGFLAYPTLVRIAGGTPIFYKLPAEKKFEFDESDFKKKVSAKTRAVIITSSSNPTGRVLKPADLKRIADTLKDPGAIVISDEIYRELYFEARPASIADFYSPTIVISGLSKSHAMTGWRLGWAYGDPSVVRHLIVMHQYTTSCASTISQRAALAAFSDEGRAANEWLRAELRSRRDFMTEMIDQKLKKELAPANSLGWIVPEGAFYLMLNVSRFGKSFEVAEKALTKKVITIPGAAFGNEAEGYLRLSFATEFKSIEDGIKRIKQALI